MLAPQYVHGALKGFGQDRVVQLRQEHQQRAAAEAKAQERAKLVEVRCDQPWMQVVERLLARAVVGFAVFGAYEAVHAIAEGDQAEQIALPFGGQPKEQRRIDEALEDRKDFGFRI